MFRREQRSGELENAKNKLGVKVSDMIREVCFLLVARGVGKKKLVLRAAG